MIQLIPLTQFVETSFLPADIAVAAPAATLAPSSADTLWNGDLHLPVTVPAAFGVAIEDAISQVDNATEAVAPGRCATQTAGGCLFMWPQLTLSLFAVIAEPITAAVVA